MIFLAFDVHMLNFCVRKSAHIVHDGAQRFGILSGLPLRVTSAPEQVLCASSLSGNYLQWVPEVKVEDERQGQAGDKDHP